MSTPLTYEEKVAKARAEREAKETARRSAAAAFDGPALAAKVARWLGPEWRGVPMPDRAEDQEQAKRNPRITRDDGATIHGWFDQHDLRITWSGDFPRLPGESYDLGPRNGDRASCTTSAIRMPPAIASELTRRVLPTYLAQYAAAIGERDKATVRGASTRAVAERIAAETGLTWRHVDGYHSHSRSAAPASPNAPIAFKTWGADDYAVPGLTGLVVEPGGTVKLELGALSADDALAIVALLKGGA